MNNFTERNKAPRAPQATPQATPPRAWNDTANERAVMVAEFHAWLIKTRIDTEKNLMNCERYMHSIAPFAQAGLDGAATPDEVPMVVLEFADHALRVLDARRKLDLLNVYYRQAAYAENTESLTIEEGNEAEVNELWNWFTE